MFRLLTLSVVLAGLLSGCSLFSWGDSEEGKSIPGTDFSIQPIPITLSEGQEARLLTLQIDGRTMMSVIATTQPEDHTEFNDTLGMVVTEDSALELPMGIVASVEAGPTVSSYIMTMSNDLANSFMVSHALKQGNVLYGAFINSTADLSDERRAELTEIVKSLKVGTVDSGEEFLQFASIPASIKLPKVDLASLAKGQPFLTMGLPGHPVALELVTDSPFASIEEMRKNLIGEIGKDASVMAEEQDQASYFVTLLSAGGDFAAFKVVQGPDQVYAVMGELSADMYNQYADALTESIQSLQLHAAPTQTEEVAVP